MSQVSPRILQVFKELHADAVNTIGSRQAKEHELDTIDAAHRVTVAAYQCYQKSVSVEDAPILATLLEKTADMDVKIKGWRDEFNSELKSLKEGLTNLESDIRDIDPDFGTDKGPELALFQ